MRRIQGIAFGLAALAAIWGCGSGGGTSGAPDSGEKQVVEVAAFEGGYGIDFYDAAAQEWAAKNPDYAVKVEGDPRVWEKLQKRFIGGTPPDLAFPGWGMDHWALAEEGQLEDLAEALKGKPAEGEGTWGDTFNPEILKLAQLDGKQYTLPYYIMLHGWWYDKTVFDKNGWAPPKTWDELMVLGEKMKAKGIAPIAYQGKYPYYMIEGFLLPWLIGAGGPGAFEDAQNLVPGAWKSPAMLRAASMIDELRKKGFFLEGTLGLDHTNSQMMFLNGKAAMVPCGTWISSEMSKSMPEGVQLRFFLPPAVPNPVGDPSSLMIGVEPWMVPSKAKHKEQAIEIFKHMTSLSKAKQFVQEKGTLMAIRGSDEGVELPADLQAAAKAYKESKYLYANQFRQWYKTFNTELEGLMASLLEGKITPQQFCDGAEAQAEKVRKDETITKHKTG